MEEESKPSGRSYQFLALSDRHKEIARRLLLGQNVTKVAKELCISRESVRLVKNSHLGKDFMGALERARNASAVDISSQLRALSPEALEVLAEALRGGLGGSATDHTKMKAALEVLDRSGHSKVTKFQGEIRAGYLNQHGIELIKARAREVGLEPHKAVDAEFTEVEKENTEDCDGT